MAEHFTVARQIRAKARQWWYHRELRQKGELAEARRREHNSVRECIREIRTTRENGGWLAIGRGGATLHHAHHARVEFQGNPYEYLIDAGILTVDTRTIPHPKIVEVAFDWPIPVVDSATGVAFEDAHGFSHVRISDMLPHYRAVGATIHNG